MPSLNGSPSSISAFNFYSGHSPNLSFSLSNVLADWPSKVPALACFSRSWLPPTYPLRPIKTNNARTLCIAAAAGTELGRCFLLQVLSWSHPAERVLQSLDWPSSSPSRIVAGSSFRSLPKIPHCCPPEELGPCLSPDVAIRSPKLAKDYRLGQPLPNQLPKPPAAQLQATNPYLSASFTKVYPVFYTGLRSRYYRITHPFATA